MKIHFIAIGGSVMHQLAIALKKMGYDVSGSDDEIFEPAITNLAQENILPKDIGWHEENIQPDIDAVLLGMHAKEDNPELIKAKQIGLKIYSFPEYIFKESINKIRVVVGGSHGKTTTTSMIMHVLKHNKKDFDYLVGAKFEGFEQSVNITNAPLIICEGDEYPASTLEKRPKFHFLFPHIAIITGIAWDHINVFPKFEMYLDQFKIFIQKIEPNGLLIFNETDKTLNQLVKENLRSDIRYQPYNIPEHVIIEGKTFIEIDGEKTELKVFGNHNLLNLYAAFFVCKELGINSKSFTKAIASFSGATKRLELLFSNDQTNIYRDFAHAPSKLKATIDALKLQFPYRKLIAVFELHTFSSLNEAFMNEYKNSMDKADEAIVFFSKHALELKRMPDLSKEVVQTGFDKKNLIVMNDKKDLEKWLLQHDFKNATLVLMSSGNYDGLAIDSLIENIIKANH